MSGITSAQRAALERLAPALESGLIWRAASPPRSRFTTGRRSTSTCSSRATSTRSASLRRRRTPTWRSPSCQSTILVCMKLSAIAGRGAAKDFWDLDGLLAAGAAHGSLAHALELFVRKYSTEDAGHVVRSLVYFGEADAAPLPLGLTPERWAEVKRAIVERVRAL